MKLSKDYLKKLIKEEVNNILNEEAADGAKLAAHELTQGKKFKHASLDNGQTEYKLEYSTGKGDGDVYTVKKANHWTRYSFTPIGTIYIDQFDNNRTVIEKIAALIKN